jgi:SpoVK/Ycf46/Vps4 family AAA+-type ATPase
MQDLQDLALIIESHVPLVTLETHDEHHAEQLLASVALKTRRDLLRWTVTEGLGNVLLKQGATGVEAIDDPIELLQAIKRHKAPAIFVLFDFHPYLHGRPDIIRHIKDIALAYQRLSHTLVFVSHALEMPAEIRRFSASFDISPPNAAQLAAVLREEIRAWMSEHSGRRPQVDPSALQALLESLRCMTLLDARRLLRAAIRDDGAINRLDIQRAHRARFELLGSDALLNFETELEQLDSVAGLEQLKGWLENRRAAFLDDNFVPAGDRPRGIMLTGVQGSGKSLAAKAVAGSWNTPLLRLDMAALYDKYIGETEKNLRRCLRQAEQMAPCILWLDEVEKGIASAGDDESSGTSRRILGTLLTWLAERKSAVFLVLTANDIHRLPAELLRKGRLDEIFFVDLPSASVREHIFRLHLQRRNYNAGHFDLKLLAARSQDFSGAEIEQAVVAAIHIARARGLPVTTEHLLEELGCTRPLAVTMAEQVDALRRWAQGRTAIA